MTAGLCTSKTFSASTAGSSITKTWWPTELLRSSMFQQRHLYWFISKYLIMCERPRRAGFIVPPLLKFLNMTGHFLFALFVLSVAVLTVSVFVRWE